MSEEDKKAIIEAIKFLIEDTGQMFSALEQLNLLPEFKVLSHNYHVVCMKALLELEKMK